MALPTTIKSRWIWLRGQTLAGVLEVVAVQRGYVDLSMGLLSAEELLETRKVVPTR